MKSTNSKVTYIQATEDCYSRMSDAEFVKEFEKIHEKDISENHTVMQAKFLPFFEANLDADAYWELYDEWESGCAYLEVYLEQYPELISQLPISELWALDPWERLMLLIRCTENAAIIKQTLEGNDIWATTLPILESAIQQKAAEICPWETLTISQKRYMSLKSKTLKKIISSL